MPLRIAEPGEMLLSRRLSFEEELNFIRHALMQIRGRTDPGAKDEGLCDIINYIDIIMTEPALKPTTGKETKR